MFPSPLELSVVAIAGLILGSFYNVCIYRIPRRLSLSYPRHSACPNCNTAIRWRDNIPLISWLLLKGRCHSCNQPISGRYPLVEFLSAALAVGVAIKFGITPTGGVIYLFVSFLLIITFTDLEHMMIPNMLTYPMVLIGLNLALLNEIYGETGGAVLFGLPIARDLQDSLIGAQAGSLCFYLIGEIFFKLTKKDGLGLGDVKLLAATGAVLGVNSLLPTIIGGSVIGAVFGVGVALVQKSGRNTEIPFGPWLALGTLAHIFGFFPMEWFNSRQLIY